MSPRKAWRGEPAQTLRTHLRVEELESRITPYTTTGNAWPHPELVTLSFVPDGTQIALDQHGQPIVSTLFHDFNALWSQSTWQNQFLKAAQVWAQASNLNFAVVADSGVPYGQATGFQQGDPAIGDIRIGGFRDPYGGYLAQAYQPPP